MPVPAVNVPTDEELIARHLAGDSDAFAVLYHRHHPGVVGYLSSRRRQFQNEAEEDAQDTFMRLHRYAQRFDPARGSLVTWLYTMAIRLQANRLRRRLHPACARLALDAFEDFGDRFPGRQDRDEFWTRETRIERATRLHHAMSRLLLEHHETLILHYGHDRATRHIASIDGTPMGTVKSRSFHAKQALRDRGLRFFHAD